MLSAIYIKGFKTFARPVRMPLEAGITAIVGPNGSGKSNITDAVLFALGEQSPGVLRAGAMGDLIFSGSDSLGAAGLAEVTIVLDNGRGEISLPYREVSLTRRILRGGETEYRINGSRSRLADVRAVAGEAGIGRHSILRQGSVDAIIAGGPAACRLALEESAGLGVYRRRRVAASRRLEKADLRLDQSRGLEREISAQLQRIEREAVAAREFRELESRYRDLSLAHLYRVATLDRTGLEERARAGAREVARLEEAETALSREDAEIGPRARRAEGDLRAAETVLDGLEDALEGLAGEALRAERAVIGLEAASGRRTERAELVARLDDARARLAAGIEAAARQTRAAEVQRSAAVARLDDLRERAKALRSARGEALERRDGLQRELGTLVAAHREATERAARAGLDEDAIARVSKWALELAAVAEETEAARGGVPTTRIAAVEQELGVVAAEVRRRGGALEAAVGAAESRARTLREQLESERSGVRRLHDVIRPLPGFEAAVEAALGAHGAGVLVEDVEAGLRLVSRSEPVAVVLGVDEGRREEGVPGGTPLRECVEVVDRRYEGRLAGLLDGIYVTDDPEPPVGDRVVVTRGGIRLTRNAVRLVTEATRLTLEGRALAEEGRLRALESGPARRLSRTRAEVEASEALIRDARSNAGEAREFGQQAARVAGMLAREAARREAAVLRAAERSREAGLEEAGLREKIAAIGASVEGIEGEVVAVVESLRGAEEAAEAAREDVVALDRRLSELNHATAGLRGREAVLAAERDRLADPVFGAEGEGGVLVRRVARVARGLETVARERRTGLRRHRAAAAEGFRRASAERNELSRRGVELAGLLASARAEARASLEALEGSRRAGEEAMRELDEEWGATLEVAAEAFAGLPEVVEAERRRLARRVKAFGDVNLLALTQEAGLRERHEFVSAQRADAEEAAQELRRMIEGIDREIEERFERTFVRVRGAFMQMVPRMISGAEGALELSEEGVEIGLRLGRRGWRPIRVLSGGERSLLALAFLFAVLLGESDTSRGTFCILDEAEAALDDVNLSRFLAVVDSYRATGQFVLVTHQKRTMASADVLYGVTQDATGATVVVSKRLRED